MKRAIAGVFLVLLAASLRAEVTTQPSPTEVERLRAQVTALQAQVAELQRELAEARRGPATKPAAAATASPIDKAIAEHKVVQGMTYEQACKAMGGEGDAVGQGGLGHAVVEWKVGTSVTRARIEAGVVKQVEVR